MQKLPKHKARRGVPHPRLRGGAVWRRAADPHSHAARATRDFPPLYTIRLHWEGLLCRFISFSYLFEL